MMTWLDQRTGAVTAMKDFLTEDVPGGASYWYVFGSATVFAMILQIVTGIFLTFYYAPSAATAWESTLFIYQKVYLGSFVISLHYWGASAMIALVGMHLLQVAVWGAYKKPREIQWVVGVLLLLFTLVLGLTGYLLPWDLNAYFASQVAINIAGTVPIIGQPIQYFLQDGATMGTLTINRFFGLHVWLTPALLVALVGAHLAIFRWNGAAGPPLDEAPKLKPGRFWPNQMFMDAFASFVIFVIIVILAIVSPAPLDAKADPNNSSFVASPAWYFTALYYLLEIFPQNLQLIATVILPGLAVTLLILVPWIDRNPSRQLRRRPIEMAVIAVATVMLVVLSVGGQLTINEKAVAAGQSAPTQPGGADAAKAVTASAGGLGNAGGGAGTAGAAGNGGGAAGAGAGGGTADLAKGGQIYTQNCAGCHGAQGAGNPGVFPPLAASEIVNGDASKVIHIIRYGLNGQIQVEGKSYNGQMPAWDGQLKPEEEAAVISYIRSSWGNKASAVTAADVSKVNK